MQSWSPTSDLYVSRGHLAHVSPFLNSPGGHPPRSAVENKTIKLLYLKISHPYYVTMSYSFTKHLWVDMMEVVVETRKHEAYYNR